MPNANITKNAIAKAMLAIMREKPLTKISVGDIVERCQMNRNSFYYHFKDNYDLVDWICYTDFAEEFTHEDIEHLYTWVLLERVCFERR